MDNFIEKHLQEITAAAAVDKTPTPLSETVEVEAIPQPPYDWAREQRSSDTSQDRPTAPEQ